MIKPIEDDAHEKRKRDIWAYVRREPNLLTSLHLTFAAVPEKEKSLEELSERQKLTLEKKIDAIIELVIDKENAAGKPFDEKNTLYTTLIITAAEAYNAAQSKPRGR